MNLSRACVSVFLPQVKELRVIRRKKPLCVSPLFPGYLFAKFDPIYEGRTIIHGRGVQAIVSFGKHPAVVDVAIIEAIQAKMHT